MAADPGSVLIDLVRVETRLYNAVDARLKDAGGLTLPQLELLMVIRDVRDCRVLDVSRTIGITVGAASKAVDRLEDQRWCRRAVDPADRRSSVLSLTPEGSAAVARATPVFDAATRDTFAMLLSGQDLDRLRQILQVLRTALQPVRD